MSDPSASFVIDLQDETSGPAKNAASALERLQSKIDADTKALRQMEAAQRRLKQGGLASSEAAKSLTDKITAQKAALAASQAKVLELGGSFDTSKKKATQFGGALDVVFGAGLALPAPIAAVTGAILALTAATTGAIAMLLRYAIATADVRRAELLRLEGLTRLRSMYGVAAGSATELQNAIDRVSRGSALGRDQIGGMATGLYRAHLRGAALRETLEALAIVESAAGEEGVRRMRGRLIAEGRAGRSARALANVQQRFGDIARRQMLSLDVQQRKLGESFRALFSGVVIDRFLEGLNEVTELFSQNTVTGRALKTIVETLVQPLIDGIAAAAPLARRFFQGMVIAVQELTIKFLELRIWLRRTFGGNDILSGIDGMNAALIAGQAVVYALVIGMVALGAAIAVAVGFGLAFVAAGAAIIAAIIAVPVAIGAAVAAIEMWFRSGEGERYARGLIDGLVDGIRNGAARVMQQIRILGADVRNTFESVLEIGSPSRVFRDFGGDITAGLAIGVERSAPVAARAVDDMASGLVPDGGAGGGQTAISIGDVNVVAPNGDPGAIADEIVEAIIRALQGSALGRGAPA